MDDSPAVRSTVKHHGYPQVESRFFRPARDAESDVLGLDEVREIGTDGASDFLSAACAI